jgi:uncharacterized protein YndB with AHSA1/START domain
MDKIEKQFVVGATIGRTWRALADAREFGLWFQVDFDAPFFPGQRVTGRVRIAEYKDLRFDMVIERMDAPEYLTLRWHPHAVDPAADYAKERPTLVEFRLTEVPGGTQVEITESGFEQVPLARRAEAYRAHAQGWEQQVLNLRGYLGTP